MLHYYRYIFLVLLQLVVFSRGIIVLFAPLVNFSLDRVLIKNIPCSCPCYDMTVPFMFVFQDAAAFRAIFRNAI